MRVLVLLLALFLVFAGIYNLPASSIDRPEYGTVFLTSANPSQFGAGSGFMVGENLFVTNSHVTNAVEKLNAYAYNDNTPYAIKVVYDSPETDLSFFEIEDWDVFKTEERYRILNIETRPISVGEAAYVLGAPYGIRGFKTDGVVAAINRVTSMPGDDSTFSFGHYFTNIINPGNSGGPVVNSAGNVIGVAELKAEDLFFAISGDFLKIVLDEFQTTGKFEFPESKSKFDVDKETGEFVITEVGDDIYKKAGLQVGDIIKSIHSEYTSNYGNEKIWEAEQVTVSTRYMTKNGETIYMEVDRGGDLVTLEVKFD